MSTSPIPTTPPKQAPAELLENRHDLYLAQADPVILSDRAERKREIQTAMDQLTDTQKLVLTLRFGNRYSLAETAHIMGKSANSIKALQYRAIAALRKKLGRDML